MSSNSEERRPGEVEFDRMRSRIEAAVELHHKQQRENLVRIPKITLEKGDTCFEFSVASLDKSLMLDSIEMLKKHIEHLKIHTFDSNYMIIQSMGENPFIERNPVNGIKFKFHSTGETTRIQCSRIGSWSLQEIEASIQLYKFLHPQKGSKDPADQLVKLGVVVYKNEDAPPLENFDDPSVLDSGTWSMLAGYRSTKQEVLESVILPLKHPEIFQGVAKLARGVEYGNIPRAVLFEGPPGVGKTTMARIIAIQTGMPLVYVPVENILSKYYGESAQNMAAIFDAATQYDKVILFLDEIDSLAGSRDQGMFEATRRVLSVLLRKMDGFESKVGLITLGATNRASDLDHALLSRFNHVIHFPAPDISERVVIYAGYAKHLQDDDLSSLAKESVGLSGRNIKDICEYAERRWARELMSQKATEASPPPLEIYLNITIEKRKQGEELAGSP